MNHQGTQPSLLDPGPVQDRAPEAVWSAVAKVAIDSPLPHLDRLFDYGIPPHLEDTAQIGCRVRVRFAGRNVDGFIIHISPSSEHADIKPIRRVVGAHPVITPEVLALCTAIAQRYAGGLADVLRLAVPPRHAATEKRVLTESIPATPNETGSELDEQPWQAYRAGKAFLGRLADGQSPRAVWSALPSPSAQGPQEWAQAITAATHATLASDRGVLIIVPTADELDEVKLACAAAGIDVLELTADMGPAARYESFLHCLFGRSPVVVGTRAAAYAPVANLGLVVCWDEMNSTYAEPRAPYPHVRETLALRSSLAGAGALFGGFARSPQAEHFVTTGWAHHLGAERAMVRERTPTVTVADDFDRQREGAVGGARIPGFAWRKIRSTLESGPVLLQVPRAGFTPGLACAQCRKTARCTDCHGPLFASQDAIPQCTWCGAHARSWQCVFCDDTRLRARTVGARRTADELGRAFPGVPVRVSGKAAGKLEVVGDQPALIVATPGAEPPASQGYPLAVLLDAALLTDLPYLDSPVAALHRWLRAAALVRGEVLILGEPLVAPAQAAVRWDPAGYARRELAEWTELGFPPAQTVVTVTGEKPDVAAILRHLPPVETLSVLGPVSLAGDVHTPGQDELSIAIRSPMVRLLLRAHAAHHLELTEAVRSAVRIRSARRDGSPVKVRVNPTDEL